jgi:hypothetical protein
MSKQYDVYVIESLVDKVGDANYPDLTWWANRPDRRRGEEGTFVMMGCEMLANGDFESVGFAPVHIPKKCVKRYEVVPDEMRCL